MLFEILPMLVYQLAEPRLTELPVELIATILRYLDPESLLNVVKTYKICKEVTLGDPILRRRLRILHKEKKKLERETRLNPALGVTVTRTGLAKIFGGNLEKTVTAHASSNSEQFAGLEKEFLESRKRNDKNDVVLPATRRGNYRL